MESDYKYSDDLDSMEQTQFPSETKNNNLSLNGNYAYLNVPNKTLQANQRKASSQVPGINKKITKQAVVPASAVYGNNVPTKGRVQVPKARMHMLHKSKGLKSKKHAYLERNDWGRAISLSYPIHTPPGTDRYNREWAVNLEYETKDGVKHTRTIRFGYHHKTNFRKDRDFTRRAKSVAKLDKGINDPRHPNFYVLRILNAHEPVKIAWQKILTELGLEIPDEM